MSGIRRRGILLSRRTGIRLSRPAALFMVFLVLGWFVTLGMVVMTQNRLIRQQEAQLRDLIESREVRTLEVERLRERIRPLEQLGLLPDTTKR